jgi:hypothetical protein
MLSTRGRWVGSAQLGRTLASGVAASEDAGGGAEVEVDDGATVGGAMSAASAAAPPSHTPSRWQSSNAWHSAALHWLRKSCRPWGVPKKHASGPRPDGTHTPLLQKGWLPNVSQSLSEVHWIVLRSMINVQAAHATTRTIASLAHPPFMTSFMDAVPERCAGRQGNQNVASKRSDEMPAVTRALDEEESVEKSVMAPTTAAAPSSESARTEYVVVTAPS